VRRLGGDDGSARRQGAGRGEHLRIARLSAGDEKVDGEYGKDWWFKVWGPEKLASRRHRRSADWMLKANAKWHGFGDLAEGFNLLDPIKCT
jgi:arginine/lysine/ornithine decarboxylase